VDSPSELTLVEDLVDPSVNALTERAWHAVVAPDEGGDPILLIEERGAFRVRGGPSFEEDLGQWEGTSTSTPSFLDFRALDGEEGMLGVLLLGGPDPSVFRWDASESKPFARLGRTTSTCDSWTIGIVCDKCAEGTPCEVRQEQIVRGALMSSGDRLFVVYLANLELTDRVVTKHTNFTGLGCTCNPDMVSSSIVSRTLVVAEVLHEVGEVSIEERMRAEVPLEWPTGTIQFERDRFGALDLTIGPRLFGFDGPLNSFPESPLTYRVMRIEMPE
jgi:hypothetical protein